MWPLPPGSTGPAAERQNGAVSKATRQGNSQGVQEGSWAGRPCPHTHFEVDRVHTQFLGVEVAELGEGTSKVIDVVGSFDQCSRHLLAVTLDLSGALS